MLLRREGLSHKQQGFITMAVSMVILFLCLLVVLNVSGGIFTEQKIVNNELRAKQAFEVAEGALTAALQYLSNDPDVDGNGVIDPVFDTNNDGIGDTNTTTIGTGSTTVTVADTSGGQMITFLVTATGYSDDRTARRVIAQDMLTIDPLPNTPENPLTAKGSVVISGSASVYNPEGQSTIWSGSDVDMGSNNSTKTQVPDPGAADYPLCMETPMTCDLVDASSRSLKGVDVIENDSSLSSLSDAEMFQNFFGTNATTYRASMVSIEAVDATFDALAQLATHEVIWVQGNLEINGNTIGCTVAVTGNNVCPVANQKPSILIVSGNVTFRGTPQIYGLLYVAGDVDVSGNVTVHGAVVVGGQTTTSSGSFDVWYNSDILNNTAYAGASTGTAGTWKDF